MAGVLGEGARVLDRDLLVALGVQEEDRRLQRADRRLEVVAGDEPLERRPVGLEGERVRAQPAEQALGAAPGRSRRPRPRPRRRRRRAPSSRPCSSPRSATGPGGRSEAIVATSSSARWSSAPPLSPCPRWSKTTAASPAARAARAKSWWFSLHGSRAVEDHHAAGRLGVGQPQRVGEAVAHPRLRRGIGRGMTHNAADYGPRPGAVARLPAREPDQRARAPRGRAAATPSSWRASSARRPTWSPRTTSAPARAPTSPPSPRRATTTSRSSTPPRRSRATAVYRLLAEEGLSCDVASGGELHLALRAGFDPARIYLHGNAKDDARAGDGDRRRRRADRRRLLRRDRPARPRWSPAASAC